MAERPILFSGPMVKAILDGQKTQTRRVVKPQPADVSRYQTDAEPGTVIWHGGKLCRLEESKGRNKRDAGFLNARELTCPYGRPGDRLWVREAFSLVPCSAGCEKYPDGFDPRVASVHQPNAPHEGVRYKATWDRCHSAPWRPSIHMPRWASRITLEVTGVRVERLQAISESDARAEGVDWVAPDPYGEVWDDEREDPSQVGYSSAGASFARDNFRRLWGKINGKSHSWESNPWVWVVEFRKAVSDAR